MTDISMADISASQVLLDAMQPPLRDCNGRGIAAGPGAGILYRAYGSADDTAGRELRFRQAMTAEIYGPIGNDPYVYDSGELGAVRACCPGLFLSSESSRSWPVTMYSFQLLLCMTIERSSLSHQFCCPGHCLLGCLLCMVDF
jgi:hypothetical protein